MTDQSSKHLASTVVALTFILTGMGAIATAVWVAFQLALDPDALVWLNQYLPQQAQITTKGRRAYKTLAEIQANIAQTGAIPQEAIALPTPNQDLLIPLYKQRPGCQIKCEFLSEIRIYRPVESFKALAYSKTQAYYQLVSQLTVKPLEESFVLASQIAANENQTVSNRSFSLTTVELANPSGTLKKELNQGVWLNLTGRIASAEKTTLYGKMVYYNPNQVHLVEMLDWTSPKGEAPVWQNRNAGQTLELVINQSLDFEPQFKLYQLQPRPFVPAPVDLEEITLATPALEIPSYQQALALARGGLWSSAVRLLQPLTKSKEWSSQAQAQLDLIRLHAQQSQTQANQVWASPSQQVLAYIIDGRWSEALKIFQLSLDTRREIAALLKADSGMLGKRIETALQVNAQQEPVRVWGALLQNSQQGKEKAIAWLNGLPPVKTPQLSLDRFLTQLEIALSNTPDPDISRITGFVESPDRPPQAADWQFSPSGEALNLNAGEIWYEIQVTGFAEGKTWRLLPLGLDATPAQLWQQLNLDLDPQIQIITAQQTLNATVKSLQWRNGKLRLLATANESEILPASLPNSPSEFPGKLALTSGALKWLQPEVIPFSELRRLRPDWVEKVSPTLTEILQFSPDSFLPLDLELVQVLDLTGDRQPEFILRIPAALTPGLLSPRTLIFNDQGELIYADQEQKQGLIWAIADFNDQDLPALMVNDDQGYRFVRWSSNTRKFE